MLKRSQQQNLGLGSKMLLARKISAENTYLQSYEIFGQAYFRGADAYLRI